MLYICGVFSQEKNLLKENASMNHLSFFKKLLFPMTLTCFVLVFPVKYFQLQENEEVLKTQEEHCFFDVAGFMNGLGVPFGRVLLFNLLPRFLQKAFSVQSLTQKAA
jgi:hypothetical protein